LGQARKTYEKRWTPDASNTLAQLLQMLPPSQRSYRKHDIHTRSRLLETQVILPETVQKIWLETQSGHKEDEQ
jgi:N-methylhydantoinase B